jgi:hypothetical protein
VTSDGISAEDWNEVHEPHSAGIILIRPASTLFTEPHSPAGVSIFEITVLPSGRVTDVRLVKKVDPHAPWPALVERVTHK